MSALYILTAFGSGLFLGWVVHIIIDAESGRPDPDDRHHRRIQDELAAAAAAHCHQPTTETLGRLKRAVGEL